MPLWVASAVWSSKEEDVIWIIIIVIVVIPLLVVAFRAATRSKAVGEHPVAEDDRTPAIGDPASGQRF